MKPDYEALERRVTKLESDQMPPKLGAATWALSLVHEDLRLFRSETHLRFNAVDAKLIEMKTEIEELKSDVSEMKTDISEMKGQLAALGTQLAEVLSLIRSRDSGI